MKSKEHKIFESALFIYDVYFTDFLKSLSKSKTSKIPGKPKRKHKPGEKRIELFR